MSKLTATYIEQAQVANFVKAYDAVAESTKNAEIKTLCTLAAQRIEKHQTTLKTASDLLSALKTAATKNIAFGADVIAQNIKAVEKVDNLMRGVVDLHTALLLHNAMTRENKSINVGELKLSIASIEYRTKKTKLYDFATMLLHKDFKRAIYGASTANAQAPTSIQALVSLGVASFDTVTDTVTLLDKTKAQKELLTRLYDIAKNEIAIDKTNKIVKRS